MLRRSSEADVMRSFEAMLRKKSSKKGNPNAVSQKFSSGGLPFTTLNPQNHLQILGGGNATQRVPDAGGLAGS